MVTQGGSDAGLTGQAQDGDHGVAQAGHDARSGAGADLRAVFVEVHVTNPVQPVFDSPVAADDGGELSVAGLGDGQRGDRVAGLAGPPSLHLAAGRDLDGLDGVGEGQPAGNGGDLQGAPFGAAVPALAGLVGDRDVAPGQAGELGVQPGLVALDGYLELSRQPGL